MKKILYSCIALLLIVTGCKKNQAGGPSIINGEVKHHDNFIPGATVYIKFNAREFPGRDSTVYDEKTTADANGSFSFKVYKGDYYLYATGIDDRPPYEYVNGGIPVTLRHKEEVNLIVAVTEKH